MKKIFIKVIQYIIFDDLHIKIGNKNSLTLFFDILYYTTIILVDNFASFRLGNGYVLMGPWVTLSSTALFQLRQLRKPTEMLHSNHSFYVISEKIA